MSDFYAFTDKVLKYLRRYIIREFNRAEMQIRTDELNIIPKTVELYDRLYDEAIKAFLRIAKHKYKECDGTDTIEIAWLMGLLKDANPITGYIFVNDEDRKRQYYTESLLSGGDVSKETKKAMRYLYGSFKEYADIVTNEAAMKAYSDTGTEFVQWNTAADERVCAECVPRNGMIYPLQFAPRIPAHYNCRCYYTRVR